MEKAERRLLITSFIKEVNSIHSSLSTTPQFQYTLSRLLKNETVENGREILHRSYFILQEAIYKNPDIRQALSSTHGTTSVSIGKSMARSLYWTSKELLALENGSSRFSILQERTDGSCYQQHQETLGQTTFQSSLQMDITKTEQSS